MVRLYFCLFVMISVLCFGGCLHAEKAAAYQFTAEDDKLLDEISQACFTFFWTQADAESGLVKDRSNHNVCSVASLGFGLAALPIGVERGYVTREQAEDRALRALATLEKSNAHHNGMFCHFIDIKTGNTTEMGYESIASSVDTALMVAGAIVVGEYFGGRTKTLAGKIYSRVDWPGFVNPQNGQVYMAWAADNAGKMNGSGKFEKQTWDWYTDETLLIALLGQGSPVAEHRLKPESMTNWQRPVGAYKDGKEFVYSFPGTLFTYMFAHCFYDFKSMGPDSLGVDWFENTRRAVLANRDWCRDNAKDYASYGQNMWGITAGSGPNDKYVVPGHQPCGQKFDQPDGGTLHSYGAGMSVPFAPKDAIAALRCMKDLKVASKPVWQSVDDGGFGYWDGFNIDENWVSDHVIGIAHGPMLLLIENARSGLVWRLMHQNKYVQAGITRAGFSKYSVQKNLKNDENVFSQ